MVAQSNISRRMSVSTVVQTIATDGPISRASLAKRTGLSKQTISEIVGNLEADGWVRTVGQTAGHIGRRAIVYEIVPEAATVASVDLGESILRVAISDLTGRILTERVDRIRRTGGLNVVKQVASLVEMAAGDPGCGALKVVVVGVPGVPDTATGKILMAPNLPGIEDVDFAAELQDRLAVEVLVENDVNLSALGEHWMDGGRPDSDLVFISVGVGIGAGIVVDGHLLRGTTGAAGEIGFLPFGTDPFEPESVRIGALERASAMEAITGTFKSLSGKTLEVPEIFQAAREGDYAAEETLDSVAVQIARASAAVIAILDPSVIVMGGAIGAQPEMLDRVRSCLTKCHPRDTPVQPSRLGGNAALAGGVSIALSHVHHMLFAEGLKGVEVRLPPLAFDAFRSAGR